MENGYNFKQAMYFLLSLSVPIVLICPSSATMVASSSYTKNLTLIDNRTQAKTLSAKTSSDWINASAGLPSSGAFYNIELADVNNDSFDDVIFGYGQTPSLGLRVFTRAGGITWVNNSTGLPLKDYFTDIEVGDLDNDGDLDFVAGAIGPPGNISLGNGGAGGSMIWSVQDAPQLWFAADLGDVNKDGILDLACSFDNQIRVYTSNGGAGGNFIWTNNSTGLEPAQCYWGVAFGDFNNDGNLDLVAVDNANAGIRAWIGNGGAGGTMIWTNVTGNLPLTGYYSDVTCADVNEDGYSDIIATFVYGPPLGLRVYTTNGGVGGSWIWTNNSTGLPLANQYYTAKVGDINGDGNLDIVAPCYEGGIRLFECNGGVGGSMIWTNNSTDLPLSGACIYLSLGDVNNDGKLDIAAAYDGQGIQVWLNNKTFPSEEFTFNLDNGWNFITLPLNNTTYNKAGDLAWKIDNCTHLAKWNTTLSSFEIYEKGSAVNNFTITLGEGYFVYVSNSTNFIITGTPISSVEMSLKRGWNSIGWFNTTTIYASELANEITNCTAVAYWNNTLGRFIIHSVLTDISNFVIRKGMGYMIHVTSDKTWVNQ